MSKRICDSNDVRAQLVSIEIAIAQKKYEDAQKRLAALAQRKPAPAVVDQARMKTLAARVFEAQGKEQDAIDAYLEAAKLAGELDLGPTLEAASKLTALSEKYAAANDVARASALRKQSDELLGQLSDAALKDPGLALTLGMAYLQAGDAAKAESWLRKALEMAPKNIDALYQLAKALSKQGNEEGAIQNLRNAVEIDPTRSEIGIELARTYEEAKRESDAEKLYDKLLAAKEPPLELRARAGRFFARIGQIEKAAEQGAKILEQQEDHPAGLYLKGEGLLKAGKIESGRRFVVQASDADPEPQYLDARGRASEAWALESGNTSYQDDAIRSYSKAVEKDPTLFTSWRGLGHLYVLRSEDKKAVEPLEKAWKLKETGEIARLTGIATKNINQQPAVAAQWLEEAMRMEPHAETAYHLSQLYIDARLNNPAKAVNALQRATSMALAEEKKTGRPGPSWLTDALYHLGEIRLTLNDLAGAKTAWQTWLNRNPTQNARWKEVQRHMSTTLLSVP
jgi:tetratricopeptide (TPR) repeat protein